MVAGGAPVIEPVVESIVEDDDHPVAVRANDPDGEGRAEEWLDSLEGRLEARMDNGGSRAPFQPIQAVVENGDSESTAKVGKAGTDRDLKPRGLMGKGETGRPGLKKLNKKQIALDWPPTPRGCEWRRSDDGLNLWRCWTEWDDNKTRKIKKTRYAGHLSDEAWRIMKEYDHEAFISIVGERLRRHSGR